MIENLTNLIVSRAIIAIVAALGGFIVAEYPKVHEGFCEVVEVE